MQQRTLRGVVKMAGKGLHTGEDVSVALRPAPENHGIVFQLNDVKIPASIAYIDDLVRGTTLSKDGVKMHTIEHLLSALFGLGVDNVLVEVEGSEIPILDGSAKPWVEALLACGFENQSAERTYWEITEPVSIEEADRSIMIFPSDDFRITCTSTDDRKTHTQHLSLVIDPETYTQEVAKARTFTTYEDIEPLIKMGKIKGGTLDCAIVIKGDKLLSNEPLRYVDEFVRHKILDIVGDLALLGKPVKGHVVAIKTGHALNAELVQKVFQQEIQEDLQVPEGESQALLDIHEILKRLPHRYPFVMVDRVLSSTDDTLVAIKNITVNEPCFTGHFPENPVFPGVLQIEAMAQAAGLLMSLKLGQSENMKNVYFMSVDKVKFRSVVQPGDQLRIEVKLLKIKNNRIGYAEGQCFVKEKVASSAEFMFMIAGR
ncbi:MAG: bifunctional UDP-3-O-[3-hydroxymyristoyl] N-acetylglucosamine deacetylase/3-hydroxyacyl-ACP dehydratase [bacterium]